MNRRTLLHVFPTFRVGGAQIRFVQLANHFGRDYRHLVIAMDGATDCRDRLASELDVTFLPRPPRRGGMLAELAAFRRMLADLRPDLLVTSNWGAMDWALANVDGMVAHLHMEDGFNPDEVARQLPRRVWTRRMVLRRSTVLLPSQTLCRIAREVWHLPARRLVYVPNGIDWRRFDGAAGPALPPGLTPSLPVVGTVATLRAEKNLSRLLEAFALVLGERPAQLLVVGDGPERPGLEAKAAALGIAAQVRFTGATPAPERFLPAFSVFALSSDTEQMPISVLEAMAAGLPVASTEVGDIRRMLAAENHPFVVAKDPRPLAQALLTLLAEPGLGRTIGEANRRRVREEYDQAKMFDAFRSLFDGTRH